VILIVSGMDWRLNFVLMLTHSGGVNICKHSDGVLYSSPGHSLDISEENAKT
jgi:hypothetical protein